MSVITADGVGGVTRAEWDALRERWRRVLIESAVLRDQALEARADAVERRLRPFDHLERDMAAVGRHNES